LHVFDPVCAHAGSDARYDLFDLAKTISQIGFAGFPVRVRQNPIFSIEGGYGVILFVCLMNSNKDSSDNDRIQQFDPNYYGGSSEGRYPPLVESNGIIHRSVVRPNNYFNAVHYLPKDVLQLAQSNGFPDRLGTPGVFLESIPLKNRWLKSEITYTEYQRLKKSTPKRSMNGFPAMVAYLYVFQFTQRFIRAMRTNFADDGTFFLLNGGSAKDPNQANCNAFYNVISNGFFSRWNIAHVGGMPLGAIETAKLSG